MKKIQTETKTITEEKVTSITCNCCGKVVEGETVDYDSDITELNIDFGYGSSRDTETHHIDICDDCYNDWILTFKHPPEIDEY